MFDKEAKETGRSRLLLTAATAPDGRMGSLDIPVLNKYLN